MKPTRGSPGILPAAITLFLAPIACGALALWAAGDPVRAAEPGGDRNAAGVGDEQAPLRPRLGLVLGGGGARGGAHVGILKVLEELRVPVDRIAGTSMGAIIGGLYASGKSPAEIETLLKGTDWQSLAIDEPPRQALSFRRKEDDRLALFPFEVGIGIEGVSLKSGFTSGHKVEFVLRSWTLHTWDIDSFDDLPIPFRAVAADVDTGEAVVLAHGDLAAAMRASMSTPGGFTPVERDGRLLVDGGIANGLPVDVARAIGAERIIAVDVGTPPRGTSDQMSPFGVFNRMISVLIRQNTDRAKASLEPEDLLIVPELRGVPAGAFGLLGDAVAVGEAAARGLTERLRAFSVPEEEYAAYLRRLRDTTGKSAARVDAVRVEGIPPSRQAILERRFMSRPGTVVEPQNVAHDLMRLYQEGEFEHVDFHLGREEDRTILTYRATPKSWGPGYLKFGLGVETTFSGDSDFSAIVHYRRPEINSYGAEWKTIIGFGKPSTAFMEFYQPLHPGRFWFVAPYGEYAREQEPTLLPTGERELLDSQRAGAGLDFGVKLGNWGEIRAGLLRGRYWADPVSTSSFPLQQVDLGGWRVKGMLDRLDNPFFPTKGNLTSLELYVSDHALGANDEYEKFAFSSHQYGGFGKHTLFGWLDFGTDFGSDTPFYDEFRLGGFLNLSGFAPGELQGDVRGLLTLGYYFKVRQFGTLGGIYAGAALQGGNAWEDVNSAAFSDLLFSATLFLGIDLRYVPVYVGYGRSGGHADAFYLFVGQRF